MGRGVGERSAGDEWGRGVGLPDTRIAKNSGATLIGDAIMYKDDEKKAEKLDKDRVAVI